MGLSPPSQPSQDPRGTRTQCFPFHQVGAAGPVNPESPSCVSHLMKGFHLRGSHACHHHGKWAHSLGPEVLNRRVWLFWGCVPRIIGHLPPAPTNPSHCTLRLGPVLPALSINSTPLSLQWFLSLALSISQRRKPNLRKVRRMALSQDWSVWSKDPSASHLTPQAHAQLSLSLAEAPDPATAGPTLTQPGPYDS